MGKYGSGSIPEAAPQGIRLQALQLEVQAETTEGGCFEILAITEGQANGWEFPAGVLRESLALWEGAECFIDHSPANRSIRDLGGVLEKSVWDEQRKGVRATLRTIGPSAGLVRALAREVLREPGSNRPRVGFSADLIFAAKARRVERIIQANSLDLVFNPARGGAFLRAIGQQRKENTMQDEQLNPNPVEGNATGEDQLQPERAMLAEETEKTREVRKQMCTYLLESGLSAARLPGALGDQLRRQFQGKLFEASELDEAIRGARQLLSELTASQTAQGPARISAMFDSRDRIQAAVDDLFEVPREKGLENLKTERLQGIRELYLMLTGDYDFHGGYDRQRAQFATTADFSGLVKNALNKIVANTWEQLGRAGYSWWEAISTVEHFTTLNQITGILVGTVGDLPVVAEGAAYQPLNVGDSPEVASFTKYGGYVPLTLELIDRDETRKLRSYARELASAGLRKVSSLVAAIFTQTNGVGPTMADSGALFNNAAVTTAGGHANLTTVALSAAQWDAVSTAIYNQPMLIRNVAPERGTGPRMAINPRYLLVPRTLQLSAMQILYPGWERTVNITSENQQRGQPGDVITVPEWTDVNDWAAVCDPRLAPAIFVGERFGIRPEIFIAGDELSPAVFSNDEHRMKVRHFLAVWVNDFRPLAKANVA